MSATERPYSRVYWEIMDDPKFDGIRDDMRLMGAWATLLLTADMAWPKPPYIPSVVPASAVKRLAEAGLIDVNGHTYQVHGLAAERERRQSAARAAALRRHNGRNADA